MKKFATRVVSVRLLHFKEVTLVGSNQSNYFECCYAAIVTNQLRLGVHRISAFTA